MTREVTYELHDEPIEEIVAKSGWLFPSQHRFAIVKDGRLVIRTRSNGSAYTLTYKTRLHAENGLRVANAALGDDVELYERRVSAV